MQIKKLIALLLTLVSVFSCMSFSAAAEEAESVQIISDQQILQAAQALITAEAQYYDISSVSVQGLVEEPKADGTTDVKCDLVFYMCLKADSVEELPYVAGLLEGIGVDSVAECAELSEMEPISASTNISSGSISISEDMVVASQALDFLDTVEENIGTPIELIFSVVLNVAPNGTVNSILGRSGGETFPLSRYFPETETQMYQNGLNHADSIAEVAQEITSELNAVTLYLYYRVDARNYANQYTSNATSTYNGSNTKMNPSYYNSAYTYYIDNDCVNFVSQAIYRGGIPQSTDWKPGQSAWKGVYYLKNYFLNTIKNVYLSDFASCSAGGFIITRDITTGAEEHVVMCVLNDTVNRAYSAHTEDRRQQAYYSGYPYEADHTADYYFFVRTTTESQFDLA